MKILKYILLLLLLFVIGLIVFIATKKNDYFIQVEKIVKTTPANCYNYVNELKNWEDFASWNESNNLIFTPSKTTIGNQAYTSWQGNINGNVTTLFSKQLDSITQKLVLNESEYKIVWKFSPVKNGTKIKLFSKGEMTLKDKFSSFFSNNSNAALSDVFFKTLNNIDRNLVYEINTFSIKNQGIVAKSKTFYIGKNIKSEALNVTKNTAILIKEMLAFFKKNNLKSVGKPFAIYNSNINNVVDYSVCLPIKDSVHISPYSDVFDGKIEATSVFKSTLTGDYSHLQAAKDSAYSYISKNNLKIDSSIKPFDVFVKTKADTKKPSQWITEIYIPIVPKVLPKKYVAKPVISAPKPISEAVDNQNNTQQP
jgi:predicted transcriptional regulator YdeE